MIIKFVTHYHKEDPNCEDKYFKSEIVVDGKVYANLGGYDVTQDPVDYFDGFVDGIKFLDKRSKKKLEELQIEYEHKSDYETGS